MTDDIVTQLRFEYASCECSGIRHDCDRCETDQQAADEIEKLREEVNLWMGAAERFAESHPQYEAFLHYFRMRTR